MLRPQLIGCGAATSETPAYQGNCLEPLETRERAVSKTRARFAVVQCRVGTAEPFVWG